MRRGNAFHSHVSETPNTAGPGTFRTLLSTSRLELDHQLSRHTPAVFHLDALRLGPLATLGVVQPHFRCLACSPRWRPGSARPSGGTHITCQRVTHRAVILT